MVSARPEQLTPGSVRFPQRLHTQLTGTALIPVLLPACAFTLVPTHPIDAILPHRACRHSVERQRVCNLSYTPRLPAAERFGFPPGWTYGWDAHQASHLILRPPLMRCNARLGTGRTRLSLLPGLRCYAVVYAIDLRTTPQTLLPCAVEHGDYSPACRPVPFFWCNCMYYCRW